MGGHGGLNILPQKRWNVYNFDNREKVRKDEEAAAKEDQLQRHHSLRRDSHLRLNHLRQLRGLAPHPDPQPEPQPQPRPKPISKPISEPRPNSEPNSGPSSEAVEEAKNDSNHMNLFAGIKIFDPKQGGIDIEAKAERKEGGRERERERKRGRKEKKEEVKVITAEDEKYRLGYGLVGKGSKVPWYLGKPGGGGEGSGGEEEEDEERRRVVRKSSLKKTLEELREERVTREKKEKEREKALFMEKSRRDRGFSTRK